MAASGEISWGTLIPAAAAVGLVVAAVLYGTTERPEGEGGDEPVSHSVSPAAAETQPSSGSAEESRPGSAVEMKERRERTRRRPQRGDRRPEHPSRAQVKAAIGRSRVDLDRCMERAGRREPLAESIYVKFRIGPSGDVRRARVVTDAYVDTEIGECVRRVVSDMKFPESREGIPVKYPFRPSP